MGEESNRVLFVHNGETYFIRLDRLCLESGYAVTECAIPSRRLNPLSIWRQVKTHHLVFGWFASWHTFLPLLFARLQNKPSILVIGGYDLADLPEAGYGHQRGGLKKWVSRWIMGLATTLVTNSYFSKGEAIQHAGVDEHKLRVIYHGIPDLFGELPSKSGRDLALTVGNVERVNLVRKGHEPFVRCAAYLPDVEFVLVGKWVDGTIDYLRSIAPDNVTFTGWVDESTWLEHYREASIYVQASAHEGFGMSVAEAMLAGCVPVIARAGALPEVVGDLGIYPASLEPEELANTIQGTIRASQDQRQTVRQRILDEFPLGNRCRALNDLVGELLDGS